MGAVWLAKLRGKHGFEKLVAIKTILGDLAREPRFREMFLDEARIAVRVEHPNVAQVLDLGEEDDLLYIVMEWVEGAALDVVLRRVRAHGGAVPIEVALRIVADAAAGLHAAHDARDDRGEPLGLVHRDVSPQNILVMERGAVKVIDFGIARARDGLVAEANARNVRGKMAYMAPEQARAKVIDRRADVWSLGAVLYELLSGAPPVRNVQELASLVEGRASIAPLPDRVPIEVRATVRRALSIEPALRFPSALDLSLEIENALAASRTPTTAADVARFVAQSVPRAITHRAGTSALRIDVTTIASMPPPTWQRTRTEGRDETAIAPVATAIVIVGDDPEEARAAARLLDDATTAPYGPRDGDAVRIGVITDANVERARRAFNDGEVDALVALPADTRALRDAVDAAIARASRRHDARGRAAQLAEEDRLRRLIAHHTVRLDEVRRAAAYAANAARLRDVGELEARRAHARGTPLSLLVYRMRRPKVVTPAIEMDRVRSIVDSGAAVLTDQYGEILALAPETTGERLRARLAGALSGGDAAVATLAPGESFDDLLSRARAEVA